MSKEVNYLRVVIAVGFVVATATLGAPATTYTKVKVPFSKFPFAQPTSKLGIYRNAAVVTDSKKCAKHGTDILKKGGTAVDAAIISLLCSGVVHSHSMGLGGGFFMTVYSKHEGKMYFLDAREVAPLAATQDMFVNRTDGLTSLLGALAIGVPGEILGLYEAKKRFGSPSIKMEELIEPIIKMCEEGNTVSRSLAQAMRKTEKHIKNNKELRSMFVKPGTCKLLEEGDVYTRPLLAETLKRLMNNGPDIFYGGEMGKKVVEEIQKNGGIMTIDDLEQYRVKWKNPVSLKLKNGLTMYSSPPPGSGAVTLAMLKMVENLISNEKLTDVPKTYQQFAEAAKFAFAQRSNIGDNTTNEFLEGFLSDCWLQSTSNKISGSKTSEDAEDYGLTESSTDDDGTTHISILDENGNAVSVTSTVNYLFGSKFVSPSTGIIFNNEMDDFSTNPNKPNIYNIQPSKANLVHPGNRPTSSMSPTVIIDKDKNARLIIGASGGPQIITTTAFVTMQHLMMGKTIKQSIDFPRIHHQLLPMILKYEKGLPHDVVEYLKNAGHETVEFDPFVWGGGRVQAIAYDPKADIITANNDRRKDGEVNGY